MQIRCDLHINGGRRKLVMVSRPPETRAHLALRLAAFVLFWDHEPVAEMSPKHPALAGQDFLPDAAALNAAGEVLLWVECGNVSLNKLDKLTRRYPSARLVVLKEDPAEGRRMRASLLDRLSRPDSVEVLAWPEGAFAPWSQAVAEATEVYGEAQDVSLNLVINQLPLAVDLLRM